MASAVKLWEEAALTFDPSNAIGMDSDTESSLNRSNSECLKKLSKWMDHTVTKLGACAAVADERDVKGLEPLASEVIKAFVAIVGTFMSLRRGAGACLCSELKKIAQELAANLQQLGASIGKPSMAVSAGKVLECAGRLEHTSVNNRQAIEKRLQAILTQIRDGHQELTDALQDNESVADCSEAAELSDEEDAFDGPLDPQEVAVAQATSSVIKLVQGVLQDSIKCCIGEETHATTMSVQDLEIIVKYADRGLDATDGLIAHMLGGLDKEEFLQSLFMLQEVVSGWQQSCIDVRQLEDSLKEVEAALENC